MSLRDNTLGINLTALSSKCDVGCILNLVSNFLKTYGKVSGTKFDMSIAKFESQYLSTIKSDQANAWFLPTGSVVAVNACVKRATKYLKRLSPKPGHNFVVGKIHAMIERFGKDCSNDGRGEFKKAKVSKGLNPTANKSLSDTLFPSYVIGATRIEGYPADVLAHETPIFVSHYVGKTHFRHLKFETTRKGLVLRKILPPPGMLPGPIDVDAIRKQEKKATKEKKKIEKRKEKERKKRNASNQLSTMQAGTSAKIQNVKSKPELNGQTVVVEAWKQQTGRYTVLLTSGEKIDLKPSNLLPLSSPTLSDSEKLMQMLQEFQKDSAEDPEMEAIYNSTVFEGIINQFKQSGLTYDAFMENIEDHHINQANIYNHKCMEIKGCMSFLKESFSEAKIADIVTRFHRSTLLTISEFMTTEWVQGSEVLQLEMKYQDESLGDEERLEAFCLKFSLSKNITEDMIQQTKNSYYDSGLNFSDFLHSLGTRDDLYECLCGSGINTKHCPCKGE